MTQQPVMVPGSGKWRRRVRDAVMERGGDEDGFLGFVLEGGLMAGMGLFFAGIWVLGGLARVWDRLRP